MGPIIKNDAGYAYRMGISGSASVSQGPAGSFFIIDETKGATRLNLTPAGRMGLNSLNPAANLHIYDSATTGFNTILKLEGKSTTGGVQMNLTNDAGNGWNMYVPGSASVISGAAGSLGFYNNQTLSTSLFLHNNGNVGMGTSAPANNLNIVNNSTSQATNFDLTGSDNLLQIKSSSTGNWSRIGTNGSGLAFLTQGGDKSTTSAITMIMANNGNVGIGNSTPQAPLHVSNGGVIIGSPATIVPINYNALQVNNDNGDSKNTFRVDAYTNSLDIIGESNTGAASGTQITLQTGTTGSGASTRLTVLPGGNIGINNTNPTAKLDVAGTFKLADGTQGANKVLTSDATGNAAWATQASTQLGSFPASGVTMTNFNTRYYTGASIALPAGKWIVSTGTSLIGSSVIGADGQLWCHIYMSDASTGSGSNTADLVPGAAVSGAGTINRGGSTGIAVGNLIINNTSGATKTYYVWMDTTNNGATLVERVSGMYASGALEKWLYGSPVN